jgi:hypothetical protein
LLKSFKPPVPVVAFEEWVAFFEEGPLGSNLIPVVILDHELRAPKEVQRLDHRRAWVMEVKIRIAE